MTMNDDVNSTGPCKNYQRLGITVFLLAAAAYAVSMVPVLEIVQPLHAAEAIQDSATMAKQLQMEGTRLQLQGNVEGAIKKYQESLTLQPNERLETLLKKLEKQVGKTSSVMPAAPTDEEKPHTPDAIKPGTVNEQTPVATTQEQKPVSAQIEAERQTAQAQQAATVAPVPANESLAPIAKEEPVLSPEHFPSSNQTVKGEHVTAPPPLLQPSKPPLHQTKKRKQFPGL